VLSGQSEIARRQLLMENLRKQLPVIPSDDEGSVVIDMKYELFFFNMPTVCITKQSTTAMHFNMAVGCQRFITDTTRIPLYFLTYVCLSQGRGNQSFDSSRHDAPTTARANF
jgi:hypothetical protein